MTVRVYRSADSSAPSLTGQAGSLIALLDACLVNGYGSKTAAGWTKPYTGTNKAAFRNDNTGGTGCYLRLDDSNATYGRTAVMGYESMSNVDTGTAWSANAYWFAGKSATTDATAREWVLVADNKRFYLFVKTGENGTDWAGTLFFGDAVSYSSSTDAYIGMLMARYHSGGIASATYSTETLAECRISFTATSGHLMARKHDGAGGGINVGKVINSDLYNNPGAAFFMGGTGAVLSYPNQMNSGIILNPVQLVQGTTSPYILRGRMPGMWAPMHSRPLANNDTFSGVGDLSGKTFEAFNVYNSGQVLIETSDTWS